MDTSNPKQAIVDKIKKSTNILVTVAHDPSVDALAAALGFTLMLNKLDKHATAVFSGAIPPAITFLQPEKTFEGTVDSLRDFIIALDKEKADRLRYKVEGDVVRIYITPYRTNISEKDLQYSQGDFNVDLIIALGVEQQSDLDQAIASHGRILHDAAVATINVSDVKSTIGTIDWSDNKASSLCEMLMSLSEALGSNLLDHQIATSLLTGIVAATDRFGNNHTSPRVMTMSAQLMAAGANQQLIAEKLQQSDIVVHPNATVEQYATPPQDEAKATQNGTMSVEHDDDGSLVIEKATHEAEDLAQVAEAERQQEANAKLEAALGHVQPPSFNLPPAAPSAPAEPAAPVVEPQLEQPLPTEEAPAMAPSAPVEPTTTDWRDVHGPQFTSEDDKPLMGGTLNATTNEAEEAARAEEHSSRNHTILSHDEPRVDPDHESHDADVANDPLAADATSHEDDSDPSSRGKTIQPLTMTPIASPSGLNYEALPLTPDEPPAIPSISELEAEVHAAAAQSPITNSIDDARAAVSTAFSTQPLSVGGQTVPAFPVEDTAAPVVPPVLDPSMPPMPDFSTLPPLPPIPGQENAQSPHPAVPPQVAQNDQPAAPAAPGQFQIPGQ